MRQHELTKTTPLHDRQGRLTDPGWARSMVYTYDRSKVRTHRFGLKEWDFYQIVIGRWVLQLTIGHVSYIANFGAILFNTDTGELHEFQRMEPLRRLSLPQTPDQPQTIEISRHDFEMTYDAQPERRRLTLSGQTKGTAVDIDLTLPERGDDQMVIATPFAKEHQFYLNCKAVFFGVTGHVRFGNLDLTATGRETAIMDWGRGVWPFHQEWFWGAGAGWVGGARFGFNIGWGFGDLSRATENMFFFDGTAVKLSELTVERDESDYLAKWRFTTGDGSFDLTMTPVFDHDTAIEVLFLSKRCHQVHGWFNGRVRLPGGDVVEIKDLFAFCEHATNSW